jgi:hypothetical protein
MAGDLASLCEDIALMKAQLGRMPDAYIPLQAIRADDFASQTLSATHGFSATDIPVIPDDRMPEGVAAVVSGEEAEGFYFRQEAVDESLRILKEIREREQRGPDGEVKPKKQAKNRPGCFFNEDGTITCRLCGLPKQPGEYYTDKQAWTGRKSACRACEKTRA